MMLKFAMYTETELVRAGPYSKGEPLSVKFSFRSLGHQASQFCNVTRTKHAVNR